MPKRKRASAPILQQKETSEALNGSSPIQEDTDTHLNGPGKVSGETRTRKSNKKVKAEAGEQPALTASSSTRGSPRKTAREARVKLEESDNESESDNAVSKKPIARKGSKKAKAAKSEERDEKANVEDHREAKAVRKRKTKEEKEAEAMPIAARTVGHKLFIGAHVSSAGGVQNSPLNSLHIGANAFALFLKSQRKWANPPLADEHRSLFHENCGKHTYDQAKHVVPHGSYLVNLAHTDKDRTEQAYTSFLDDLKRCESLGIKLYNFHPGVANSVGGDRPAAIKHLASNINRAHRDTSTVVTLLENMAAGGNVLGSTFEDLRDIIALIDDKNRVGVCLDTCHAFAGGYDLRSPEAFQQSMERFEDVVGIQYLRALHMNDSKAPFASHRDLHANIGTGFLGLRAFHNIVNDSRFIGLPLILETPIESRDDEGAPIKDDKGKEKEDKGVWAREIKLLESLVGMDVEGQEFLTLEAALAKKGAPERNRLMEQIERKREKDKAKEAKANAKGKKSKKAEAKESEDEDSGLSDQEDR